MIELRNLTKRYAGTHAVEQLTFSARAGDVLGVLGPNGAGKSTSMRMLCGTLMPTCGTASVHGFDIRRQRRQAQSFIGYVPEGVSCPSEMRVRDFLSYIAEVRGFRGAKKRSRCEEMIELFDLASVGRQRTGTLSKGFRRRVDLAQAMLHDPQVLILDEPTDGLDPAQKQHVRELIKHWARHKTVLISTHLLEEVSALCNRVVVISKGQLQADSTPQDLEAQSRYHQAVTLYGVQTSNLLALAVLPGVAGVERSQDQTRVTIFARPGAVIAPSIDQLITREGWQVKARLLERGRLEEVFLRLVQESGQ